MNSTELKFDVSDLNSGQKEAFNHLKEFLLSKDSSTFILKGYAGTGKTYLVQKFINYIHSRHPKYKVAVTAPTNKAVKVLAKATSIKDYRVAYQTIHKLLGLTEDIQHDGTIKFSRKFDTTNEIRMFKVLIVDEVSMLADELFYEIIKESDFVKIIFMGDPAQIPPVNKADCIPFNEDKKPFFDFNEFTLTEIMRQGLDNPIVKSSFDIRNNLTKKNPILNVETTLHNGKGVIRIDANSREERDKMLELFGKYFKSEEFANDADYAKVIAWRNVTVNKTNAIIRSILFGENISKIMDGEKLVVRKPITEGFNTIIFNTSEELTVEEFNIATGIYRALDGNIRLKYYDTIVTAIDIEGTEYKRNINILHEDSQYDFDIASNALKKNAIDTKGANKAWVRYYSFLREFADVAYNYAITGHLSQGSTYKNVFIIEDDIDMNPNIYERNRIKYTSYSRPTNLLYILKR